jgi:hypothetical protein
LAGCLFIEKLFALIGKRKPRQSVWSAVVQEEYSHQGSLTGAEFEPIKPCLEIKRQSKWKLLYIINPILYSCNGGIRWRNLPPDFVVPWQTVHWYVQK